MPRTRSLESFHRHIVRLPNKERIIDVVPACKDAELIQTWDWACNAMLGICVGVNQILEGTPAGLRLFEIADRYDSLKKNDGGLSKREVTSVSATQGENHPRTTRQEFIRKIAYAIWEKEGRPDGKDLDHWFHAEAVVRGMPAHDGIADLFDAGVARRSC